MKKSIMQLVLDYNKIQKEHIAAITNLIKENGGIIYLFMGDEKSVGAPKAYAWVYNEITSVFEERYVVAITLDENECITLLTEVEMHTYVQVYTKEDVQAEFAKDCNEKVCGIYDTQMPSTLISIMENVEFYIVNNED